MSLFHWKLVIEMWKLVIRRPTVEDASKLNEFFRIVITDTFQKEGIENLVDDMEDEINTKVHYLDQDIVSGGIDRYFLIALYEDKIIGTIEYGAASDLISRNTNDDFKELNEVGTVFVHPDYQRQGVGNELLNEMFKTLENGGIKEICLDSGYKTSQQIWIKKFGEPNYLLMDFWGEGSHHMIWKLNVRDLLT